MSEDLGTRLDGLVAELGPTRVRKLARTFVEELDGAQGAQNPVLKDLIVEYGADEVTSAFRKLADPGSARTVRRDEAKVGRNDPCTCGSGKKFKKCCG